VLIKIDSAPRAKVDPHTTFGVIWWLFARRIEHQKRFESPFGPHQHHVKAIIYGTGSHMRLKLLTTPFSAHGVNVSVKEQN
jgi:hypothetical protein